MTKRLKDNPQKWLAEEAERIRARKDLSEEGKLAHLGRAYKTAKAAADSTTKANRADWEATRQQHLRRLLGPAQHTGEWRRMRDKALEITKPDQLRKHLESAIVTGDREEAAAYGAAALDRALAGGPDAGQWISVVNAWGASDPTIDDRLTALSEHEARAQSTAQKMFSSVPKPNELERNHNWERHLGLADGDDRSDLTDDAQRQAEHHDAWNRVSRQQSGPTRTIGGGFD